MIWSLALACAPTPASIELDMDDTHVTVHSLAPIALPGAVVLDDQGLPISPQPALTWSVSPTSLGAIRGDTMVPATGSLGEVRVRAGELSTAWTLDVQLPDRIRIDGYTFGQPLGVGESLTVTGVLLSGDVEVPGPACSWATDDTAVVAVTSKGVLGGRGEGVAEVTCTIGELTASIDVASGEPVPAVDRVEEAIRRCQQHTRKAVNWQLKQMMSPSGAQARWLQDESAAAVSAQAQARRLLAHAGGDPALAQRIEACDDG